MNKLRESFEIADTRSMIKSTFIDKFEQITDDAMIQFADWLELNKTQMNYHQKQTTTELQQYFKENVYGK